MTGGLNSGAFTGNVTLTGLKNSFCVSPSVTLLGLTGKFRRASSVNESSPSEFLLFLMDSTVSRGSCSSSKSKPSVKSSSLSDCSGLVSSL